MKRLMLLGLLTSGLVSAAPISIVAAENFYGDVARQIGGPQVSVTSILSSPSQDPHLFEASPSTARALSAADIVVYSGIDYDPWMDKLLSASKNPQRRVLVVAAADRQESRRQPPCLVRPGDHARSMPSAAGRTGQARSRPHRAVRRQPGALPGVHEDGQRQGGAICGPDTPERP